MKVEFKKLKERPALRPVLGYTCFERSFVVETDVFQVLWALCCHRNKQIGRFTRFSLSAAQ